MVTITLLLSRRRTLAAVALACLAALSAATPPARAQATGNAPLVRLATDFGPVDIQLDSRAPATVANFLSYLRSGRFDGTVLHRLVPGFVVQGGGFRWVEPAIPRAVPVATDPPVVNEFSPDRSNLRGTVAMAKLGGNPNSATSQWFVNLADNALPCPPTADGRAGLDCQNGGFTVFGRVTAPGMEVVGRIAVLNRVPASGCTAVLGSSAGAMGELPVRSPPPANCNQITADKVVLVRSATELEPRGTAAAHTRIFDYLEAAYPQFAAPASPPTLFWEGYTYRYYAATNSYAGVRDGVVYYLVPEIGPEITPLGSVADWLAIAQANGY